MRDYRKIEKVLGEGERSRQPDTDRQTERQAGKQTDGQTDGRMDELDDGRTDRRKGEQIYIFTDRWTKAQTN